MKKICFVSFVLLVVSFLFGISSVSNQEIKTTYPPIRLALIKSQKLALAPKQATYHRVFCPAGMQPLSGVIDGWRDHYKLTVVRNQIKYRINASRGGYWGFEVYNGGTKTAQFHLEVICTPAEIQSVSELGR